ncbi:MAG: hypothetical protein K2K75_08040 [Muribaculaceae bacterium]|nr:hypothetical protein [Muribaculaceae bacterium]
MENRKITLADIFLDVLSISDDKGTKLADERIKAAIKSPDISELLNICVVNALGFRAKIKSKTVDNAVDGIINFVHAEIDNSNLSDSEREKESHKYFAKYLGDGLKDHLRATGQLL